MASSTEIRVKLHIKASDECEVKNLWMCLNYDQKPTVGHVIEHIKKNLIEARENKVGECKLYLDNYWLPPYENSRLVRENDCIKVEVAYEEETRKAQQVAVEKQSQKQMTAEKIAELNQNVLNHIKATEKRMQESRSKQATAESHLVEAVAAAAKSVALTTNSTTGGGDYYSHYYEQNADLYGKSDKETSAYNHWLNNDYFNNQLPKETNVQPKATTTKSPKPTEPKKTSSKPAKDTTALNNYKKFAIGHYAHMLSEPVQAPEKAAAHKKQEKKAQFQDVTESDHLSEEKAIDNCGGALQKKASSGNKASQRVNENSQVFEQLANHVNSAANKKWKNSTQPPKQNGPKHIIFKTSSSGEASSSESESETAKEQLHTFKKSSVKANSVKCASSPAKKITLDGVVNGKNKSSKFYEPSKEEQLEASSYNRSYFIKNTTNLQEFKKTFNEEKLNAPQAEEFADKSQYPQPNTAKKTSTKKQLDTSTDSTGSEKSQKSKSVNKMNYEGLEKLVGAPRVNDKIAFQVLEISSNFTPEVSDFKTGTVVEFDEITNEITLEMNTKYNQVLKRSNKFSVILDDTDVEADQSSLQSQEDENTLKIDWRNLMNLKLIPDEKLLAKQQELAESNPPHIVLHV